jgi:tetratricopeptide (TPR) repeat protein
LQTASTLLKHLIDTIPSDGDAETICVKTEALYHYVVAMMNRGNYDASLNVAQEALALVDKCPKPVQKAKILWAMGLAKHYTNHYHDAEDYYHRSLNLSRKINNVMFMMSSYIGLGGVSFMQGNLAEAITLSHKAIDLAKLCGNALYESYGLNNIGAFYSLTHHYEEAIPYFEAANELTRKLKVLPALALGLINLGLSHIMLDRLETGFPSVRQGLDLAQEITLAPATLLAIGTYAALCHKRNQRAKAATLFAFVLTNPKTQPDDLDFFNQILDSLHYTEEELEIAAQQAHKLELESLIAEILRSDENYF